MWEHLNQYEVEVNLSKKNISILDYSSNWSVVSKYQNVKMISISNQCSPFGLSIRQTILE